MKKKILQNLSYLRPLQVSMRYPFPIKKIVFFKQSIFSKDSNSQTITQKGSYRQIEKEPPPYLKSVKKHRIQSLNVMLTSKIGVQVNFALCVKT